MKFQKIAIVGFSVLIVAFGVYLSRGSENSKRLDHENENLAEVSEALESAENMISRLQNYSVADEFKKGQNSDQSLAQKQNQTHNVFQTNDTEKKRLEYAIKTNSDLLTIVDDLIQGLALIVPLDEHSSQSLAEFRDRKRVGKDAAVDSVYASKMLQREKEISERRRKVVESGTFKIRKLISEN
jgi:hypothetical protein